MRNNTIKENFFIFWLCSVNLGGIVAVVLGYFFTGEVNIYYLNVNYSVMAGIILGGLFLFDIDCQEEKNHIYSSLQGIFIALGMTLTSPEGLLGLQGFIIGIVSFGVHFLNSDNWD